MFVLKRRWLSLALFSATAVLPRGAHAQTSSSTISLCTQGALFDCAIIKLTQTLGISPGLNFFEVAINNLGSVTQPSLATAINGLIFDTGHAPTTEADVFVSPTAQGGALVFGGTDAWDIGDSGDVLFVESFDNNGVGGCVAGGPVDDGSGNLFGQDGTTCGSNDFLAFSYSTPTMFDLSTFSVSDVEVVGLGATLTDDSCGATGRPCLITPEPASLALLMTGFAGLAGYAARRRKRSTLRLVADRES
jgi:hypothetical protein